MQCLPGASTAHGQQQHHDAGSNVFAAPPMLPPFRVAHGVVVHEESHDLDSARNRCPVLGAAKIGQEETSIVSFGSNGTKKRSAESCPKLKHQGSHNSGTEDSSNNKKKKEETTKQSKNEKKVSNTSKGKSKPPETDYIHVRARRGQATDSHSLAERVRREKISERMKYLQDLVPGCNKIMGKASMLDEIINYVQSLQRQVEFLSMKLSAVSPGMHFIDRELNSSCNSSRIPVIGIPHNDQLNISGLELDCLQPTNSCSGLNMSMNSLESVLQRTISTPVAVPCTLLDSYFNVNGSSAWDSGFQGFYGVEFQQGGEAAFPSQSFQGTKIKHQMDQGRDMLAGYGSVLPNNLKMEV